MSELSSSSSLESDLGGASAADDAGEIRRAVENALVGARQELLAAEGLAAARQAEIAGARYSSRPVDAGGRGSSGREVVDLQPAVGLLSRAIGDLGEHELRVVRHEEELLRFVASALPSSGSTTPESKLPTADSTVETPVVEIEADDDLDAVQESPWRRVAAVVGLIVLACVGVLAFLISP